MYKRENLVVLIHLSCITQVVTLAEAEQNAQECKFKLDLKNGQWQREYDFRTVIKKIGEMVRMNYGCRYGVIGVYDRTEIDHLNRMVSDNREATRSQGCLIDDD